MYKLETHLHSLGYSPCAQTDTKTIAKLYSDSQYDGIICTNHFDRYLCENYYKKGSPENNISFFIKDVITEIEPELFKKVTGLSVKDFDILCSIGLFDSEKMNQGIFGFRKYENASLSYTGIDKHAGESVGGWDTVLRREEYEELYGKQQATMTDFEEILIPEKYRAENADNNTENEIAATVANKTDTAAAQKQDEEKLAAEKALKEMLAKVQIGASVTHKKFGSGTIVWIDSAKKYLRVKFDAGEKQFVFPDAFIMKFLEVK